MKIAVYGASGYQGKLVLTELARRDIEMVLAGRDLTRLEEAASAVGLPTRNDAWPTPATMRRL